MELQVLRHGLLLAGSASGARVDGVRVRLEPGVTLSCRQAVLLGGLALQDGVATAPSAELLDVALDVDVPAVLAAAAHAAPIPDLRLLDTARGHARVDAVVGLLAHPAAPHLTNHLRATVRDGALDYRRFEASFHPLADAVLHFRLRGSRLELEKDVPLLPWDEATLVAWRLDAEDRALAREGRVRLRRLLEAQVLDAGPRAAGGKGCYAMGSLALEALDVALDLGPGELLVGSGALEVARLEGLQVQGALRCARGAPPAASTLTLGVRAVEAALRDLTAAGVVLGAERLVVSDVTGALAFEGLEARRLTLTAPRVRLEGLTVEGFVF